MFTSEIRNGRTHMNVTADSSLLPDIDFSSTNNVIAKAIWAGFYHVKFPLLWKRQTQRMEFLGSLAERVISLAEHAQQFRQTHNLELAARFLSSPEAPAQYQRIGLYYKAVSLSDGGDLDNAQALLEEVISGAPEAFRARAFARLGFIAGSRQDWRSSREFYFEAGRMGLKWDMRSYIHCQKMISVFLSMNGDHREAVSILEKIRPQVLSVSRRFPLISADFNNSLAIEMSEVGRFAEAHQALDAVMSSPFYDIYQVFRETNIEVSTKLSRRHQRRPRPKSVLKSGSVLDMEEWIRRKHNEEKGENKELTPINEKILRICADLVDGQPLTEQHLCIIERIVAAYDSPKEVLDKIIEILNVHLPMEGLAR